VGGWGRSAISLRSSSANAEPPLVVVESFCCTIPGNMPPLTFAIAYTSCCFIRLSVLGIGATGTLCSGGAPPRRSRASPRCASVGRGQEVPPWAVDHMMNDVD
jgi:hypothetical protein